MNGAVNMNTDTIFSLIDRIGVVVGIIVAIPIFWTWYEVFGSRKRRAEVLRRIRQEPGSRPSVLIVDLLPNRDVRPQVENFCRQQDGLKEIPVERYFIVSRADFIKPDQVPALQNDLRAVAARIMSTGTDVLHCFIAGPVSSGAWVGSEFSNAGFRVLLYQNESGNYVNFGPLRLAH